jgi:16S rRNA C967 or C1407 C5-methylase (RsmB/RsmF family)/NOL1/NOP2/fmu family ribosome biogenesis protein
LPYPELPPALLSSLVGAAGYDQDEFKKIHESGAQSVSIRFNPLKLPTTELIRVQQDPNTTGISAFLSEKFLPGIKSQVPWSTMGYYLKERPAFTFDPLFHGGAYYVQEASSMFLEQAVRQTVDLSRPLRVLDLCAAPGGKSTLLQSILSKDSLLLSNELIKSRLGALQENMIKWGGMNGMISSSDPSVFSRLENYFDLIIVDAPCSGSGLFRRDPEAIREWSVDSVRSCSLRQRRILTDVWPALRKDGVLIYSTCSYSQEENEQVLDKFMEGIQAESLTLKIEPGWNIIESKSPESGAFGYRFYPDKIEGEGFFISCLRKTAGNDFSFPRLSKPAFESPGRKEKEMLWPYLIPNLPLAFFKINEMVFAIPENLLNDFSLLQQSLYLKKSGILLGKCTEKELIPHHELALSKMVSADIKTISLSREDAIRYLRKDELVPNSWPRGWTLVQYEGINLGWIKVLDNRINNYYPMEWRILKRE